MPFLIHVLLIVAGVFLLGNALVSCAAANWVQQVSESWWFGPLTNRFGVGRARLFLILNAVLSGFVALASMAAGVYALLSLG